MKRATITPASPSRNSRQPHRRHGFPLTASLFVLMGMLLPLVTRAQLPSPSPDGGYPGRNTAEGEGALSSLVAGTDNTAVGNHALINNAYGSFNTAVGSRALRGNGRGGANTAIGYQALLANRSAENTATGYNALLSNTTGYSNTATGARALSSSTKGVGNVAVGASALFNNTIGSFNVGVGDNALLVNTTGADNTALGADALGGNGSENTATGSLALSFNRSGSANTATGYGTLVANDNGNNNVAEGVNALCHNTTGSANIALGVSAGAALTTGSNNIDIGNEGISRESNTIRIGTKGTQQATFIAGIHGKTTAGTNAVPVVIDSEGQLGTVSSSARFKDEIKPMDKTSETILGLKPVTFHYKSDNTNTAQFGLIAEEVAKANPDLVVRDDDGQIYTVRYDAVNAMLLNEFLKEHRKVEEMKKQIEVLTTGLQKVSDQLEVSKAAPQMITSD